MEITNIILMGILFLLVYIVIVIHIQLTQIKLLMTQQMLEPKVSTRPPEIKSNKLKYNPANLFNPYAYSNEDELDPVIPGSYHKKEVKKDDEDY